MFVVSAENNLVVLSTSFVIINFINLADHYHHYHHHQWAAAAVCSRPNFCCVIYHSHCQQKYHVYHSQYHRNHHYRLYAINYASQGIISWRTWRQSQEREPRSHVMMTSHIGHTGSCLHTWPHSLRHKNAAHDWGLPNMASSLSTLLCGWVLVYKQMAPPLGHRGCRN